jgi:predicted Zn-dependent peptidase
LTVSKLENGVTVVTESSPLADKINMGLLIKLGTRDETLKTSGALHSIQTCYYKSFANTNETINYGMVQMSGGHFKMNFNRESMQF